MATPYLRRIYAADANKRLAGLVVSVWKLTVGTRPGGSGWRARKARRDAYVTSRIAPKSAAASDGDDAPTRRARAPPTSAEDASVAKRSDAIGDPPYGH